MYLEYAITNKCLLLAAIAFPVSRCFINITGVLVVSCSTIMRSNSLVCTEKEAVVIAPLSDADFKVFETSSLCKDTIVALALTVGKQNANKNKRLNILNVIFTFQS